MNHDSSKNPEIFPSYSGFVKAPVNIWIVDRGENMSRNSNADGWEEEQNGIVTSTNIIETFHMTLNGGETAASWRSVHPQVGKDLLLPRL